MNELLLRRRQLLNEDLLPAGCVELEYLESDSNQWINTKILPKIQSSVKFKCERVSTSEHFPLGCRISALSGGYVINFHVINKRWYSSWSGGNNGAGISNNLDNSLKIYEIELNNSGCTVNDSSIPCDIGSLDSEFEFYLFVLNQNGLIENRKDKVRLHYVYFNNVDQDYKFIPVLDPSGRPCMYETVGKQYYYNQGTGEFSYKIKE